MLRTATRSLLLALTLAAPLALPGVAAAQSKCLMPDGEMINAIDASYWGGQMDAAQKQLDEFQLNDARYTLLTIRDNLRCLTEPARPTDVVRYARLMALMAFFDQDEVTATKWGFLASYTVPDMPWPADMPPNHPLRNALSFAEEPPAAGPIDKVVRPPKKGLILMNGHLLAIPQARAEVPNYIQVFDKKGELEEAFWQDGAAFRAEYLAEDDGGGDEPELPKWYVPFDLTSAVAAMKADPAYRVDEAVAMDDDDDDFFDDDDAVADAEPLKPSDAPSPLPKETPDPDVEVIPDKEPDRSTKPKDPDLTTIPDSVAEDIKKPPKEKIPKPPKQKDPKKGGGISGAQLGVGVGLGVVAGGMVGLAFLQEASLSDATSEADMLTARARANQLVVGSGVVGVAALGVGVTAFIHADGPGLGLGWTW